MTPSSRTPWTGRTEQSDPTPRTKPNHKMEVHKMEIIKQYRDGNERHDIVCLAGETL